MNQDPKKIWARCLASIRQEVDDHNFETWFAPIEAHHYEKGTLTLRIPNRFFYEWLEGHYIDLLRKVIHKEIGASGKLAYQIAQSSISTVSHQEKKADPKSAFLGKVLLLNPKFTFENFIVGECNQLAQAASQAVAQNPGKTSFNPLLIHGDIGLGKTHVVQAIAHQIKKEKPYMHILYTTTEEFTSQFVQHLRQNKTQSFIDAFLDLDVLIIDDIQFLGGKEKTQEIFFHIFNHLHQHGKQIIMTSDVPPSDLKDFKSRLVSRFKWGLTTDLQRPDLETRIAIMEQKLEEKHVDLQHDMVTYIATQIQTNVRELEGVVNSLLGYRALKKKEITPKQVKQVLQSIVSYQNKHVHIDIKYLQKLVSNYFKIPLEDLRSSSRKREIVMARQIAMYLAKKYTDYSLGAIGSPFGKKDHSTVGYALRTIKDLMETDSGIRMQIDELEKRIEQDIPEAIYRRK